MIRITDRTLFVVIIFSWLFLRFNYNPSLSTAYLGMAIGALVLMFMDEQVSLRFETRPNKLKSFILASVGSIAFIAVVALVNWLILNVRETFDLFSAIEIYAETVPIFAGSMFFTILVFAVFIPITETAAWTVLFEYLKDKAKGRFDLKNKKLWAMIIGASLLFMLFHLTAKTGTGSVEALTATFLMMVFSLIIIVIEGQMFGAVLFHIILNSLGLLARPDVLSYLNLTQFQNTPFIIMAALGFVAIFAFATKKIEIRRIIG